MPPRGTANVSRTVGQVFTDVQEGYGNTKQAAASIWSLLCGAEQEAAVDKVTRVLELAINAPEVRSRPPP